MLRSALFLFGLACAFGHRNAGRKNHAENVITCLRELAADATATDCFSESADAEDVAEISACVLATEDLATAIECFPARRNERHVENVISCLRELVADATAAGCFPESANATLIAEISKCVLATEDLATAIECFPARSGKREDMFDCLEELQVAQESLNLQDVYDCFPDWVNKTAIVGDGRRARDVKKVLDCIAANGELADILDCSLETDDDETDEPSDPKPPSRGGSLGGSRGGSRGGSGSRRGH